ncbi:MAG: DUF4474 domain-containing protein [Acutalibacteraceae bacterium]
MKSKAPVIAVSAVAAAVICIAAVLAVKMSGSDSPAIEPNFTDDPAQSYGYSQSVPIFNEITSEAENSYFFTAEPSEQTQQPEAESKTLSPLTSAAATVSQAVTSLTEKVTQLTTVINKAFSEVFTMPKAPKYIPPDTDIDFNKVNLASYKYDPNGNYYYTDDKECWQKNFGFNEVYDKLAPISIMYYDTVRTTFEYDGKEWLIQTWKGQYGYCFVGGEVGIYTRPLGKSGTHFSCADKPDWLNMEMAFVWDEDNNGNYKTIFTRPYTKYWWCTGFVVGFPNGSLRNTLTEFRLITHITFKDTEMANAFCTAFEKNGFRRVSKLNNNEPDTFVQVGADVAFVWQNIDQ